MVIISLCVLAVSVSSALAQTSYILYSVSTIEANTTSVQKYNTSHWEYWLQGASGYGAMRSYGCHVVAYSKMMVEMGIETSNTASFNPDKYFEWGIASGYHQASDTGEIHSNGESAIAYAASKGTTISKRRYDFSANASKQEKANIVQKYLDAGYYVVMCCDAHYTYIGRAASKQAGEPIVLDSWFSYIQNAYSCYYLKTTDSNFNYIFAFWKGSNPPAVDVTGTTFSATFSEPTDATYTAKIKTAEDNVVVVKHVKSRGTASSCTTRAAAS
jgi:hypothetical protein